MTQLQINNLPDVAPYKILLWNNIKNIKASEVPETMGYDAVMNIAWKMVKACLVGDGIGLAATQVGITKRILICREFEDDGEKYKFAPSYKLYINPEFTAIPENGKATEVEYCLSVPGQGYTISRHKSIYASWNEFDEEGKLIGKTKLLEGFPARLYQHECLGRYSIIETEDGKKTIKEVVETGYDGRVYCLDENQNVILSNIIGWKKRPNKEKKQWIRIKTSNTGPNKQLICTEDHPCFYVENILSQPIVSYTQAKNLSRKYIVRKPFNRKRNAEAGLFNKDQVSVIVGGLLGDLHISKRGEITISHGQQQKEYAAFKADILNGLLKNGYSGYKQSHRNISVYVSSTEQTKLLRQMCYVPSKSIRELVPYINDLALAIWYMDDGCLVKNQYAQFHTEGFSKEDVLLLKEMLEEKFELEAKISHRYIRGSDRWFIRLNKNPSRRLFSIISKYVTTSMDYKLPEEFRKSEKRFINNERLSYSAKFVKDVKEIFYESCLFDIEVEKYHNFFADNTLVHNCDHLNGISIPQRWEMQNGKRSTKSKSKKSRKK